MSKELNDIILPISCIEIFIVKHSWLCSFSKKKKKKFYDLKLKKKIKYKLKFWILNQYYLKWFKINYQYLY